MPCGCFFFSSRRRHTRSLCDWSSDVCSSDLKLGAQAALVKGGHLPREEEGEGDEIVDVLVMDGAVRRFTHTRLDTTSTHGTGCTLSAAIAAGLAHGRPLERAVEDALDFVHRAIAAAPGLGHGHGPLNHFVPAPPRPPTDGL